MYVMFGPVNAGAIAIQSDNLDLIRFGWTIPTGLDRRLTTACNEVAHHA